MGFGSVGVDYIVKFDGVFLMFDVKMCVFEFEIVGGGNCVNVFVVVLCFGVCMVLVLKVGIDGVGT